MTVLFPLIEQEIPEENVYTEIPARKRKMGFLNVPRFSHSRSSSPESSDQGSVWERKLSGRKKHSNDSEKVSVASNSSKKSTVERLTENTFFRRRADTDFRRGDDDEHVLETLRQVVRKCTAIDPEKRPTSNDLLEALVDLNEKP